MAWGFKPIRLVNGSPYNGETHEFDIDPTYTTAIGQWHPVAFSSGKVQVGVSGSAVLGVLMGVKYNDPTGKLVFKNYWPGTASCTNIKALVADNPDLVFEVETATAAGSITAASVGTTGAFAAGSINSSTGVSGAQMTVAGDGFVIVAVPGDPKNALPKTNAAVHVTALLHTYGH